MSKYIHYIYALLFGGLLVSTVICFHNNTVLESRIKTLNKLTPTANSEKTFKEDYYITQQSNDTTLILTCFGLGFALFSFFTYQGVVGSVSDEVSRMKKNYKTHKNDYNIQHKYILDLKKDLNFVTADLYYKDGKDKLKDFKHSDYVLLLVVACEKYCLVYQYPEDENEDFLNSLYDIITSILTEISEYLNSLTMKLKVENTNKDTFDRRIRTIKNTIKESEYLPLATIISKLQFTQ